MLINNQVFEHKMEVQPVFAKLAYDPERKYSRANQRFESTNSSIYQMSKPLGSTAPTFGQPVAEATVGASKEFKVIFDGPVRDRGAPAA